MFPARLGVCLASKGSTGVSKRVVSQLIHVMVACKSLLSIIYISQ